MRQRFLLRTLRLIDRKSLPDLGATVDGGWRAMAARPICHGRRVANARRIQILVQMELFGRLMSRKGKRSVVSHSANPMPQDLAHLTGRLAAGTLVPVVDNTCPLAETAEAFRYLEGGYPRGKVGISV